MSVALMILCMHAQGCAFVSIAARVVILCHDQFFT
jgi:hypothetical protein